MFLVLERIALYLQITLMGRCTASNSTLLLLRTGLIKLTLMSDADNLTTDAVRGEESRKYDRPNLTSAE